MIGTIIPTGSWEGGCPSMNEGGWREARGEGERGRVPAPPVEGGRMAFGVCRRPWER
jgi:hypothetical protein